MSLIELGRGHHGFNQADSPWRNPKCAARCRELWDQGDSAGWIADKINREFIGVLSRSVSRCAVIGLAHRQNFPMRKTKNRMEGERKQKVQDIDPTRRKTRELTKLIREKARNPGLFAVPENFQPLAIPFLKIGDKQCREILNERGEDGLALFCGHKRFGEGSYCQVHSQINYGLCSKDLLRLDKRGA